MPQVLAPYASLLEVKPGLITIVASEAIADVSNVNIILGTAVNQSRRSEIMSAVNFLRDGLNNRPMINFLGSSIFTCVSIDNISWSNRRTSGTSAGSTFGTSDIAISIGLNVTALGKRMMLWNGIDKLRNYLLEQLKNGALV
jgi:hypothetical protein